MNDRLDRATDIFFYIFLWFLAVPFFIIVGSTMWLFIFAVVFGVIAKVLGIDIDLSWLQEWWER